MTDETLHVKPFQILTVCTGNVCRSPMAERLLQSGVAERFPNQFVVESAGTGALVGSPIDPQIAAFIRQSGGNAESFSARQLTAQIIERQDLVLALTKEHRSRVVEMSPLSLKRTFTLREFARILPSIQLDTSLQGSDRWRFALSKALRARSAHEAGAQNDDVIDPYRRSDDIYQRMRLDVTAAVSTIISNLVLSR